MKLFKLVLRIINHENEYWPAGRIFTPPHFFKTKLEAKQYFLSEKVKHYKHKLEINKFMKEGSANPEIASYCEKLTGTTFGGVTPYNNELVGVISVEIEEI